MTDRETEIAFVELNVLVGALEATLNLPVFKMEDAVVSNMSEGTRPTGRRMLVNIGYDLENALNRANGILRRRNDA